jgi:Domain of unknown function (DUF2017)
MEPFRSVRGGGARASLAAAEASLLRSLVGQVMALVEPEDAASGPEPGEGEDAELAALEAMVHGPGGDTLPEDPVLARLLPSAYREDEEAAAEFRRFTERSLRQSKVNDGALVLAALQEAEESDDGDVEFVLDRDAARAWMRWLTALRLTLAERLGVTAGDEEYWESLAPDDERLPLYEIYSWLGYLLESLVGAVQR